MKRLMMTLVAIAIAGIFATLGQIQASTELARINNTVINLEEFTKRYQENAKFFPAAAPKKTAVLDDLIKRELGIQEARKLGLDRDPEVIDRMNTVLYHALLDRQLSKEFERIHITDDEAKAYYARHPEIRTSHLFVAVPPTARPGSEEDKAAHKRIEEMLAHLKSGKMSFAEVAQKYSDGPSAPMGGDIDYQTRDKLDPAYYDAASRLKPGQMTGIIRSSYGYHVIRLTSVRSWEDTDKALVKRSLFDQRRADLYEKYMSDLRKHARVTVHSELLKD